MKRADLKYNKNINIRNIQSTKGGTYHIYVCIGPTFYAKILRQNLGWGLYKVRQFKNETGPKIWLIHRILQFNSYPLQCTLLPYLHTAAFVSSIVQSSAIAHQPPGRSVAVPFFAFTSSADGKWVPFSTLFTLVYRKSHRVLNPRIWRMFKQKRVVRWGIVLMQHPDFVLPDRYGQGVKPLPLT